MWIVRIGNGRQGFGRAHGYRGRGLSGRGQSLLSGDLVAGRGGTSEDRAGCSGPGVRGCGDRPWAEAAQRGPKTPKVPRRGGGRRILPTSGRPGAGGSAHNDETPLRAGGDRAGGAAGSGLRPPAAFRNGFGARGPPANISPRRLNAFPTKMVGGGTGSGLGAGGGVGVDSFLAGGGMSPGPGTAAADIAAPHQIEKPMGGGRHVWIGEGFVA